MDKDKTPITGYLASHSHVNNSPPKHNSTASHDSTSSPAHDSTEYTLQSHDHLSPAPFPVSTSPHEQEASTSHDTDPAVVTEETLSKLYQDDAIGDTVFSKAWVLSMLVEIVKAIEAEDDRVTATNSQKEKRVDELGSSPEKMNCSGEISGSEEDFGGEGALELEKMVEDKLCTLWDASMNTAVAEFVHQQGGIDLLLGAAHKSNKPRLSEICLGMIGNLLCCQKICLASFEKKEQRNLVLQFFQGGDSGVLCQVTRLTQTFLSYEELQPTWLPEIMESESVKEALLFILQGSTNDELLTNASTLLDLLLNLSDQLLVKWVDDQLVEAICEAAQETSHSQFEVTCTLVATLHTLTSVQEGVACVLSCAKKVSVILCNFLGVIDQLENISTCFTSLTAACSLQLTLLENNRASDGSKVLKILERLKKNIKVSSRTQQLVTLISSILDSLCTEKAHVE